MTKTLQVLIIETSQVEVRRLLRLLREAGYDPYCQCAENEGSLRTALNAKQCDLILCDDSVSGLRAVDALQTVYDICGRNIPFIVVSDKPDAETAVKLIKAGARDYVPRQNPARLMSAIEIALGAGASRPEKRQARNNSFDEHTLLKQIITYCPDAVFIRNRQGRYTFINDAGRRILNVPDDVDPGELTTDALLSPERARRLREEDEAILATGESLIDRTEKITQPDGLIRWLSASKVPLKIPSGEIIGVIEVTRDITRRMQEDEDRLALQNRFNHILDLAPDAIITTDSEQRIALFNKSAEKIFGYSAEEVCGQLLDVLIPPHLAAGHRRSVESFGRSGRTSKDMSNRDSISGRHKSGREFPAEASISKYTEGDEAHYIAVVRDITARRYAEEQLHKRDRAIAELNERLLKENANLAAANSELESFSYSVSHDLRAPLRAIDGFSRMLQEEHGQALGDRAQEHLSRIRRAAQRMGLLIDDLLTLARISRLAPTREEVDLSAHAREVLATLRTADPQRAAEINIASQVKTSADARLLRIALENLLGNAWKFTRDRSPARIEFGAKDINGESVYYISDNGVGFDMTYAGKLFGAFQRLHDDRQFPGDGIGLAIVQRIINKHGGRVWAEAAPDKGATFYFTL